MSAISGLREAVCNILPLLQLPPGNKSEKLRGLGQRPSNINPGAALRT